MSRDIDLTKPLSESDIAYLKERHPLETVARYVEVANEAGEGGSSNTEDDVDDFTSEDAGDHISGLDEEGLRALSVKLDEVVQALLERADELGIELEEFPVATAEDVVEDDDDQTPPAAPEEVLFDPNDHKVDKIQEYFMTASPEEIARVKDLEAKGQKRKTVLDA